MVGQGARVHTGTR